MRKTNKYNVLIILLILAGFFSCSKDDDEIDPPKAIIGKWERVGVILYEDTEVTYIEESEENYEFFSDGRLRWHRYEAGITMEGTYVLEPRNGTECYLVLTYLYDIYLEYPRTFNYTCEFINKNEMTLTPTYISIDGNIGIPVYKRKK